MLYALLVAQIGLGFALRWLQGGELSFFGLFSLPSLLARSRDTAEVLEFLHKWNGWAIVLLAAGHAAMALLHHYWLKDGVLRRMLPAGR
jgi:cytochrome b561